MNSRLSSDRGAAAVEMAMVMLFLVLLLLGIVDVGRAISANISVRDAVQDGASFGAYGGPGPEESVSLSSVLADTDIVGGTRPRTE